MTEIEGIIFFLVVVWAIFSAAKNTAKQRAAIKARTNQEYDQETELTSDELQSRLGDSEIMYENLEQTYWLNTAVLIGLCSYFYWNVWYLSIGVVVLLAFVGCKFMSVKPFSTAIPNR